MEPDSLELSFECTASLEISGESADPPTPTNDYVMSMQQKERPLGCIDFKRHPEITPKMRAILFDWLMKVAYELCCRRQTLYLALSYVDSVLILTTHMPKKQFQVLGLSAIYLAAKTEEVYLPKMSRLCTDSFTEEDIKSTELLILKAINWN